MKPNRPTTNSKLREDLTKIHERIERYREAVERPVTQQMWMYPQARLNERWQLESLAQRVMAADTLGYTVRLRVDRDGNLWVEYIKRPHMFWAD